MEKMVKIFSIFMVLLWTTVLIGCSGDTNAITLAGSTTVEPVAILLADTYSDANPDVTITVQGGGSSAGVKGAAMRTADIGMASRELTDSEKAEWPTLITHHMALDGVAVIVHPSNSVSNLSLSEVQEIFAAGTGSKWTVISREAGSGTREVFEEKVMSGVEISANAEYLGYNGAVKQKVAGTQNAIGYLSLGYVDSSVKTVTIDNVACTPENCLNNSYPISRFLNFITMGEPEGITLDFLNYCLSEQGQSIVTNEGYIKVN